MQTADKHQADSSRRPSNGSSLGPSSDVRRASDTHPFRAHVNPFLGEKLSQLKLDKRFVRGDGIHLFDADGHRYLDFVSGYGALPFGYNPRAIWAALDAVHTAMEPSFVQPSALNAAGELAARLLQVAPGFDVVTFTNSGAEAVEATIKMARSRTGRMGVLATRNSFHGKTLGALSATGNNKYQKPFGAPVAGFDHVPFGDADALREVFENRPDSYAAFIVEPIQGEGGIVEAPPGYLREAERICRAHGVLLVLDEIQTGLGRTGAMFAYLEEGVSPDILTFGKAIGGGLLPLSGCMSTKDAYTEDFGLLHSSTFAGNTLACRVGIAVLDLLCEDGRGLVRHVQRSGARLKNGLRSLQRKYPELINEVRGRGYLLGIELAGDRHAWPSNLLGIAADQGNLAPLVASYLANVERIRVAPTLNGARVLRVEPPLIATRQHCDAFLGALDRMFKALSAVDTAQFLGSILDEAPRTQSSKGPTQRAVPTPQDGDGRFAFLMHPLDLSSYVDFDPTLGSLTREELQEAVGDMDGVFEPFVCSEGRVVSPGGRAAFGHFIVIPRTTKQMTDGCPARVLADLRKAVRLAKDKGAQIVGLGAFTSIVSAGGRKLLDLDVPLTTGNSYTVAAAHQAIHVALRRLGQPASRVTAAVVGAGGSIGRAMAILLAQEVAALVLVGNPKQDQRIRERLTRRIMAEIALHIATLMRQGRTFPSNTLAADIACRPDLPAEGAPLTAYESFCDRLRAQSVRLRVGGSLLDANVIVTATSSSEVLVGADDLQHGALVCDLARPRNVGPDVPRLRPDVLLLDGGIIELPGRPDLGRLGLERGLAYACMAETMLLAMAKRYEHHSVGADLDLATIDELRRAADEEGFRVAGFRSFDRPLAEADIERIIAHRNMP